MWIQEILTDLELIVDSTKQNRAKPDDPQKQKKSDSGKKKNHTFKNQIITTEKGTEIVDVIVGQIGPESDINLLRKQQKKLIKNKIFRQTRPMRE